MDELTPHPFENLGGIPRPKDPRDILKGSTIVPSPYPAKSSNDFAWQLPIFYQGKRPACGAHALAWLYMFLAKKNGTDLKPTPRFTWIDIKKDGSSPSEGTDMRTIFKSGSKTGLDPFEPLENDVTFDDVGYAAPHFVTDQMKADALKNLLGPYSFDENPTFEGIKQHIDEDGAVLLLIRVGNEFWTAPNGQVSWLEKDILPLRTPSPVVSGHFIVAHNYDEKYIYFANSFSDTWGRNGHGYFGVNYLPFVNEVGMTELLQSPSSPVVASIVADTAKALETVKTLPTDQQNTFLERIKSILLALLPFLNK